MISYIYSWIQYIVNNSPAQSIDDKTKETVQNMVFSKPKFYKSINSSTIKTL